MSGIAAEVPADAAPVAAAQGARARVAAAPIAPLSDAELASIRSDFPILGERIGGRELVYLDWGATSQRPRQVVDAEVDYVEHRNAAVHRGAHTLAAEATEEFELARETVAAFVGAGAEEIVWTSNATESLNAVAYAIGNASLGRGGAAAERYRIGPGDEILATELEHHANLIPWQELAARTGATFRYVPVDDEGALRLDLLDGLLSERTKVFAFTHVSNVTGEVQPVAELVHRAHAVGALAVLDACQSAPHLPLGLHGLGVDFAAFSGHKMLGPTGIGVLYGRRGHLEALPPFLTGGSMITTVTMDGAEFLPPPQRFEAGTQRVSQAIALGAAVDYLTRIGIDRIAAHEAALGRRLVEGLQAIDGVRMLGPVGASVERTGVAAIDVPGIHAHDLGQHLDGQGIAIRVGHHCAQPLHRRLGTTASTRASTYLATTPDEVDAYLAALPEAIAFFRRLA